MKKMRAFALLSIPAVMLVSISAFAQGNGTPHSGMGASAGHRGTVGMSPDTPGTNSLGTAQSAGGSGGGQGAASVADDPKVRAEERKVDQSLKSVCRGC